MSGIVDRVEGSEAAVVLFYDAYSKLLHLPDVIGHYDF